MPKKSDKEKGFEMDILWLIFMFLGVVLIIVGLVATSNSPVDPDWAIWLIIIGAVLILLGLIVIPVPVYSLGYDVKVDQEDPNLVNLKIALASGMASALLFVSMLLVSRKMVRRILATFITLGMCNGIFFLLIFMVKGP